MYKIENTYYGYHITFSGLMDEAEAMKFKEEVESILPTLRQPWSSIIDLQTWVPPESKVLMVLNKVEQLSREHGLQRRAIILRSPLIKAQATQLSFMSGTRDFERCIDASKVENWEEQAIGWAVHGLEPTTASSVASSPD